jgi:hypothetical protein
MKPNRPPFSNPYRQGCISDSLALQHRAPPFRFSKRTTTNPLFQCF